jgi:hypothetical protein
MQSIEESIWVTCFEEFEETGLIMNEFDQMVNIIIKENKSFTIIMKNFNIGLDLEIAKEEWNIVPKRFGRCSKCDDHKIVWDLGIYQDQLFDSDGDYRDLLETLGMKNKSFCNDCMGESICYMFKELEKLKTTGKDCNICLKTRYEWDYPYTVCCKNCKDICDFCCERMTKCPYCRSLSENQAKKNIKKFIKARMREKHSIMDEFFNMDWINLMIAEETN